MFGRYLVDSFNAYFDGVRIRRMADDLRERQVVVIVEGPDKSGKTNIAKALAQTLGVPYFKNRFEKYAPSKGEGYFVNALRYVDTYMGHFLNDTGHSVVLDRAWPSEWVYSRVYDRETDNLILRYVDELWAKFDTTIVVATRSSYAGMADDVHEEIDAVKLEELRRAYGAFTSWTRNDVMRLPVDDEDLNRQVADIVDYLHAKHVRGVKR